MWSFGFLKFWRIVGVNIWMNRKTIYVMVSLKIFFNVVIKSPEKSSKCSLSDLVFKNNGFQSWNEMFYICDIATPNILVICVTCLLAALLQIYPTDQSVSSYSSNPSTPVSSPPPLAPGPASGGNWPPHPHPASPHFPPDHRTLHMVSTAHVCFVFSHSATTYEWKHCTLVQQNRSCVSIYTRLKREHTRSHSYQQVNCLALYYKHPVFRRS